MELFPWSTSEELVDLLKSCPTGYPRAATALLRQKVRVEKRVHVYNLPDRKVSDLKQVQNARNNKHNEFAVFECFGSVFKSD